jgi:translation elongation factor P/translation initiation factor 5A
MALSSRSIRKGITIKFDGHIVDKQVVLEASKTWEAKHEALFTKLLKQGGKFTTNGVVVEVIPQEQMLTSRGEKDGGITVSDPLARF